MRTISDRPEEVSTLSITSSTSRSRSPRQVAAVRHAIAGAIAAGTSADPTDASGTNTAPPACSAASAAGRTQGRVLPHAPAPVTVSQRASAAGRAPAPLQPARDRSAAKPRREAGVADTITARRRR